jgi:ribose-phosphate pyrophosphokinase
MDMMVLKKSRDRKTGEVSIDEKLDSNVEGKDVLIVDDMISTGESIVKACLALKKNKSGKVYAICAHALLIGDAKRKLKAAGIQDIIATNSIPSEFAKVDLSHIISENIINVIQSC